MPIQSHHGRQILPTRLAARQISSQVRCKVTSTPKVKAKASPMHVATTDIAHQLEQTGVWKRAGGRKKATVVRANEPWRVNIVSRGLCDDIMKYIGPSLQRHRNCDLIDLNPGAGLWSRVLHDHLQPRRHIMMDDDADLYRPLLGSLLAKSNVDLIPKSGLVWKELLEMIRDRLYDQSETALGEAPSHNNTLLVTANLSMYPKKSLFGFDSIGAMALHQLMSSIRTATLFQKYGLVRMLVWVNDEDKRHLLPRSINRRRKSAFEAELSCEWIHEVAGLDTEAQDRNALRDEWINMESACHTLRRMKSAKLVMPTGRHSLAYSKLESSPELWDEKLAGVRPPTFSRPFKQALEELQHRVPDTMETSKRLKVLQRRERAHQEDALVYLDLLQQLEAISEMAASSPAAFAEANVAWNSRVNNLAKNARNEFNTIRDSYHLFRQSPPALLWDRRAYEPLLATEKEFFPNAPSALLDIQPKAMHPLFREHASRAGQMSDVMLRFWLNRTLLPVQKAMEELWGGFGDLITQCPSLRDPARGGTPLTGHGALTVRAMNSEQWTELLQAWMNWPCRPSYVQALGRLVDETDDDADDEDFKPGAAGVFF